MLVTSISSFSEYVFKRSFPQRLKFCIDWLRAISSFPTVFSKGLFPRDIKRLPAFPPFPNMFSKGVFLRDSNSALAGKAISPFPTVFSAGLDNFLPFSSNLKLSSANSFSLEGSKICRLVMVNYQLNHNIDWYFDIKKIYQ